MKYIAQPYYTDNSIGIFALPVNAGDAPVATIALNDSAPSGPNCVVLYQDSAATIYLFVSFDLGNGGAVDIYQFASLNDLLDPGSLTSRRLTFIDSVAGMAVQPGTGDLYVAAFSNVDGNGGVFQCPNGYTSSVQFSSNQNDSSVTSVCSNLAFDLHENLWMTTFDSDGGQFLICYTQVSPPDRTKYFKIANGQRLTNLTALAGSAAAPNALFPFSAPEGIAFDPAGNLWLGNNNDVNDGYAVNGTGNGTLLKISKEWIDTNLLNYTNLIGTPGFGNTSSFDSNDPLISAYYLKNALFGGLFFDGFTMYLNDQGNGNVWQWDTRTAAGTCKNSNVTTTYPGNGTMTVFDTAPAMVGIRDVAGDTGLEPDALPAGSALWESPDIAVTLTSILSTLPQNNPAGSAPILVSEMIDEGKDAFVQVCVTNYRELPTSGTEVLKIYWAKASAGLNWPTPWAGMTYDTNAGNTGDPVYGSPIGEQALGTIKGGTQAFFEFLWPGASVPDSALYSVNDQHFCLLARIEANSLYPFGMTFREETNSAGSTALLDNVGNDRTIAWRNIAIMASVPPPRKGPHIVHYPLNILGANHSPLPQIFNFTVETLGQDGKPAPIKGKFEVHAQGRSWLRLCEARLEEHLFEILEEGRCCLHNPARGIENLRLHAGETLPFLIDFTPEEDVRDFAVRVSQHVATDGVPRVVGGQTFVIGKVAGFLTKDV